MKVNFIVRTMVLVPLIMITAGVIGCRSLSRQYIAPEKLAPDTKSFIEEICKRTWQYFELSIGDSGIPPDHMLIREDGKLHDSDYTTITNLGLYLLIVEAAVDLNYITREEADTRLEQLLSYLETMKKSSHGLFYNYFIHKEDRQPADDLYVSSVDNAWLAAGLLGLSHTPNPDIARRAKQLFDQMDFSAFYDNKIGQMRLGYSDKDQKISPNHYGQIVSEARVLSYLAIGKGDVPSSHWYRLYRTLPSDWTWQTQKPHGREKQIDGIDFFQGYYVVDHINIVPSWGGSLFEFLMPLLIVPEMDIAKKSFAPNNCRAVAIHEMYALKKAGYPVWGLSPCAIPSGIANFKYGEFGIKPLGSKGYPDKGIISPHASVLAIEIDTQGVIDNLRAFIKHYPDIWTKYGFYDSVNVKTEEVAPIYLSLDQAMIFLALHNYLTGGKTRQRVFVDGIRDRITPLLVRESFFR